MKNRSPPKKRQQKLHFLNKVLLNVWVLNETYFFRILITLNIVIVSLSIPLIIGKFLRLHGWSKFLKVLEAGKSKTRTGADVIFANELLSLLPKWCFLEVSSHGRKEPKRRKEMALQWPGGPQKPLDKGMTWLPVGEALCSLITSQSAPFHNSAILGSSAWNLEEWRHSNYSTILLTTLLFMWHIRCSCIASVYRISRNSVE